ncbi:hypothetical protein ACE103_35710 [Bradyrhizobium sp. ma5]|uniref:hypothetical protein n=1 Tax=Bradyrhizobium sp. ma5 TaxID=3344828 RepID=UPI0035D4CACA
MKRLAEHAPHLNIFSAKFVLRDDAGREITEEGRQFLVALEAAAFRKALPLRPIDPSLSEPTTQAATDAPRSSDLPGRRRRDRPRRRSGKTDPLAAGRRAML